MSRQEKAYARLGYEQAFQRAPPPELPKAERLRASLLGQSGPSYSQRPLSHRFHVDPCRHWGEGSGEGRINSS